jgi:uncharacterized protein GlcG (DUF336 family)
MISLSLRQAEGIVDSGLDRAREMGLKPLTIAVLDAGGHLVAFKRQDRSGILRPDIAQGKAWGALGMGLGGQGTRAACGDGAGILYGPCQRFTRPGCSSPRRRSR